MEERGTTDRSREAAMITRIRANENGYRRQGKAGGALTSWSILRRLSLLETDVSYEERRHPNEEAAVASDNGQAPPDKACRCQRWMLRAWPAVHWLLHYSFLFSHSSPPRTLFVLEVAAHERTHCGKRSSCDQQAQHCRRAQLAVSAAKRPSAPPVVFWPPGSCITSLTSHSWLQARPSRM